MSNNNQLSELEQTSTIQEPKLSSIDSLDVESFLIPKKYPSNNSSMNVAISPCQRKSPLGSYNCNIFAQRVMSNTLSTASIKSLNSMRFLGGELVTKRAAIQVDELDLVVESTSQSRKGHSLLTIKEVSDSFSSSARNSKNSKIGIKNHNIGSEFSFFKEDEPRPASGKSKFALPIMIGLVESVGASSEDEDSDSDDDISVFEGDLLPNPVQLQEDRGSSSNYESSIEMEILMNGLNNNNHENVQPKKSFNCCFSLFTSKDLESKTEERNIENRQNVEFLRFTEPCKNKRRRGSLPNLEEPEIKRPRFRSCPRLPEHKPCEEAIETIDYDEDCVEFEKMVKDDDTCPLCDKALRQGVYVTCYDLCGHFYHEECVVDTMMQKWMDKGCINNMCLLCPKCIGVEKWRQVYQQM